MNIAKVLVLAIFSLCTMKANGQQQIRICEDYNHDGQGIVRIIADTEITNDIKPAVITGDEPQMPGVRIQVFAGTDRAEAQKLKNELSSKYNTRTYMIYESPYYKVRIGDYRSRLEAQPMFHELKLVYNGILLVPGLINLPELKQ